MNADKILSKSSTLHIGLTHTFFLQTVWFWLTERDGLHKWRQRSKRKKESLTSATSNYYILTWKVLRRLLHTTFYVLFIFLTFLIYYSRSPCAQVVPNYTNDFVKVSFCTICSIVHMTHTVSADTKNSSLGRQTKKKICNTFSFGNCLSCPPTSTPPAKGSNETYSVSPFLDYSRD